MDTTSLSTKKERGDSELKQEGDFSGCVLVEWSPHQPGMAVVRCATRREVEEIRSVHSSIPNSFYHLIVLDQRLIFPITV
jgi:hypothetical protein